MHKKYAMVAASQLNQWAMSFNHNKRNIIQSLREAKRVGAAYRLGPELEVSGYGCEDHFFELDTVRHGWDTLHDILADRELTKDLLCDIGMAVHHKQTLYNCRVLALDQRILLIRPKLFLAGGNNYREGRWFTPWTHEELQSFTLPEHIQRIAGQRETVIGNAVVKCNDTTIACEICEEIFVSKNPHVDYSLDGVEIIANGSGSHHELRKLNTRLDLIRNASARNGGVYMYSNLKGCDGGRILFDGSSNIAMNGTILGYLPQFSIGEVDTLLGALDLDIVRSQRAANNSRGIQSANQKALPVVRADIDICRPVTTPEQEQFLRQSYSNEVKIHDPIEEIALAPALWLWDYLRRSSGARGFFLPLSGGADSASVAAIVASMAQLVFKKAIEEGDESCLADLRRVVHDPSFTPTKYQDIVNQLFVTCYLGTQNSSKDTLDRARRVAEGIGSNHYAVTIDEAYEQIIRIMKQATGKIPKFNTQGGTDAEDLALQNIQARTRMVVSFFMAQLVPWARGEKGFLLVLSSANIAEGLYGYMTKYDCSSGDLNPIGGINKSDLKKFLSWFASQNKLDVFREISEAKPSAELRPFDPNATYSTQDDEEDMGLTYAELDEFGKLRKIERCGPLSMFERLVIKWDNHTPRQVAEKVKRFFKAYSKSRHKMTVLTPGYHAESYGNDDNRFDLRQFLYDTTWDAQFSQIDSIVNILEKRAAGPKL